MKSESRTDMESTAAEVRKRAAMRLPLGLMAFALAMVLGNWLLKIPTKSLVSGWGKLLLPCIIALPALVWGLELITGIPFMELSSRWDSLEGWQRGVIGTMVVVGLLVVLFGFMVFVLPHF